MQPYFEESKLDRSVGIIFGKNNADDPRVLCMPHWHTAWEVLYIRRGEGIQTLNTETAAVRKGSIVLIRPGDVHATTAVGKSGCDVDVLQFSDTLFPDALFSDGTPKTSILPDRDDSVSSLFEALQYAAKDTRPGQRLRLTGLVQCLMGTLIAVDERQHITIRSHAIGQIVSYLEQTEDLGLEQTASRFGYSSAHLSRKFHAEMGVPYREWCEQIRMRRAAMLLHDERISVSLIAERLKYSDASSFIRAFKRIYGITPYQYSRLMLPMEN